ncbi:unnamed protein product, partial [Effrenium voratum]
VGIISTDEGYQYAELKEKITLTPGEKYVRLPAGQHPAGHWGSLPLQKGVLASSEISGGDFFYDKAGPTT